MQLSSRLTTVLHSAGWYPGRRLNPRRIVRELTRHHFVVHSAAEEFLREFGNLTLKFKPNEKSRITYSLEITGVWPENPLLPGIANAQSQVGPLTPVFLFAVSPYLGHRMMAPDGRVFYFIDGIFGDPRVDNVVWGPQPSALAALEADVALQAWPIFRTNHDSVL